MHALRAFLRGFAALVWYLGWLGLGLGLLLLLVDPAPSPGSEWDVAAVAGPFLVLLGGVGLLVGGVLRRLLRR